MRTWVMVIISCAFLVACDTPSQPIPSARASPEIVSAPGPEPVTEPKPEARILLPNLDEDNLVYIFFSDPSGSSRYMAPDQHPAAIELLQVLSQAPETGQVPVETPPVFVLDIRLRDRTGLFLHHLGGTKANVYAGGQVAALDIPGLAEAIQKLAALPPEVNLGPAVTSLPEPVVILTGREAEEFRLTSAPNPVPTLPGFSDFGLGLRGTLSPDGRRVAFTFGISDGTGCG
jgi:hypothetical protein